VTVGTEVRGMKIAAVGSGVSGLVAAWRLHRRHEVTVFEAADWVGGHAHTVPMEIDGAPLAVDTGFIVYNEPTYPRFAAILAELGVPTRPTDMSFSVGCNAGGLEWSSCGLNGVFAQRRNLLRPRFRRMLRDLPRFNREAQALLTSGDEKVTLGDWLCGAGYSREFLELYIVPMGAAIWSADPGCLLEFPAASFARFFHNHGLLDRRRRVPWRVVEGGSARYVEALAAGFRDRIRTRTPVRAVRRHPDRVDVFTDAGSEPFDRVILACHSDEALALLADPSPAERQVLGSIAYQPNDVALHTDPSLMPRTRRAWASWNYRVPRRAEDATPGRAVVTYHMNRLQGFAAPRDVFVTLNATDAIDPGRLLAHFRYDHPVLNAAATAAQRHHARIDGVCRTHFCGAYWGYGFHEDGVRSALAVCARLGEPPESPTGLGDPGGRP